MKEAELLFLQNRSRGSTTALFQAQGRGDTHMGTVGALGLALFLPAGYPL